MSETKTTYKIELLCDYHNWWRYNVYIMVVGYDQADVQVGFNDFTNRVCDPSYDNTVRIAPKSAAHRNLSLECDPCNYIKIYIYAVTNTFPESINIKDSPPFPVTLRVETEGVEVENIDFMVNQWGGLTVVAHRVDRSDVKSLK